MFIILYPNSKTFSCLSLMLKIYFLLGFKDLHNMSQIYLCNYFLCLTLYQGPTLEPCWYPRNPSLKAQQPILGLGISSHSPFLLPHPPSRSPCTQSCLILPALPALPFFQACELLCPRPEAVFPRRFFARPARSHPLVLRVNITPWTGLPFYLKMFSHHLLSGMALCFFPSWPVTHPWLICCFLVCRCSSQLDGRPHEELFCLLSEISTALSPLHGPLCLFNEHIY